MALLGIAMLAVALAMRPAAADETRTVVLGVGLVVGLPGTGDSTVDDALVESSLVGVLRRAGLDLWPGQIAPGRVAKVMVTAELPEHPRAGSALSVSVTPIGDAASLAGGTLLATPLRDQDGTLYGVGQGPVDSGAQFAALPAQLGASQAQVASQ